MWRGGETGEEVLVRTNQRSPVGFDAFSFPESIPEEFADRQHVHRNLSNDGEAIGWTCVFREKGIIPEGNSRLFEQEG